MPMAFAVEAKPLKQDKAANSKANFFMMVSFVFCFFSFNLDALQQSLFNHCLQVTTCKGERLAPKFTGRRKKNGRDEHSSRPL
jgi:hypothetical protein